MALMLRRQSVEGHSRTREARRDLQRRGNLIEREMRTRAVGGAEKDEVVAFPVVATDIAEGCQPERRLTLQIIDAQNDRADAEHYWRSA